MLARSVVAGFLRSMLRLPMSLLLSCVILMAHRTLLIQCQPYASSGVTLVVEALMRATASVALFGLALHNDTFFKNGEDRGVAFLVLFINLLIAMFNDTYQSVHNDADAQWKMYRVAQVKSYVQTFPVPPPFNIPTHCRRDERPSRPVLHV